jgi:uncharacterized protein
MNALLVIAKQPAAGQTKTRLAPPLTLAQAASLYAGFLADTLDIARGVPDVARLIYYAPGDAAGYFHELAPDFGLMAQAGAGLGERLNYALTRCLQDGCQRVVVMDSDSPTLPAAYVAQAFASLADHDVVLGPCDDGGYYLIGLNRPHSRLLSEVVMSQPHVLRDTLRLAALDNLSVALLPGWYDVDTADELARLQAELLSPSSPAAPRTRALLADWATAQQP